MTPPRMAAIWCPDWPVTTARAEGGLAGDEPIAVMTANRVVACSHTARQHGITRGLRRREAQGRCPELVLLARNEAAEARAFEPILGAIESISPGVELVRPGLAAIGIVVLHALSRIIGQHTDDVLIGVADGAFAAEQAARRGTVVTAGGSAEFLASLPVHSLDEPELVNLLIRLGIRTLGAFAALPAADVQARFGPAGAWAHRQSGGLDSRPVAGRRPPEEFQASIELEPPLDTVDTIAFTARAAIENFVTDLADHGLACTCFELVAQTDRGEETVRRWRHAGVLTAVDITDRLRWQLEGWLHRPKTTDSSGVPVDGAPIHGAPIHGAPIHGAPIHGAPTGPICKLVLIGIDTVPLGRHQKALWGGDGAGDDRAYRALARVQTLLGPGSVSTPVLGGGRGPAQRTRLIAWGDEPDIAPAQARQPWPGRLASPAPSVLIDPPRPVRVLDDTGRAVLVTDRGTIPSPPTRLELDADPAAAPIAADSFPAGPATGRPATAGMATGRPTPARAAAAGLITAWAGPWPVDDRWWDADSHQHLVRLQLVDTAGRAYLVCYRLDSRQWFIEGIYD
jgi:protein ImuB